MASRARPAQSKPRRANKALLYHISSANDVHLQKTIRQVICEIWYNVVMKITDRLANEADGGEDKHRFVKEERVDEGWTTTSRLISRNANGVSFGNGRTDEI